MRLVSIAALLACGCLTPRSIMLGQTAAGLGRGSAEIGVAAGVGYATQTAPPIPGMLPNGDPQSSQLSSHAFVLPAFEGNALFGLGDHLGINAHFSSAGVQPGLKITFTKDTPLSFAIMPQFAVGYGSYGQTTYVTGPSGTQVESMPSSTTSLTFMAGIRAIVSHKIGFYGSVGYDLILTRSATTGTIGVGNMAEPFQNLTTGLQHEVNINVGWSVDVNWLRIRPEISVGIIPAISQSFTSGDPSTPSYSAYGGSGFVIMPGFSLVALTPKVTRDVGAEEDEHQVNPDSSTEETPTQE